MTKKMTKLTLLSTLVLGSIIVGGTVEAAPVGPPVPTKGDITFIEDPNQKPNPVDPTDPDPKPIIPDPETPLPGGLLRFDQVPKISFGKNFIVSKGTTFYAMYQEMELISTPGKFTRPTTVEVTDVRGGTKGWSVSVSNDGKFTNESDASDVLTGIKMTLKDPTKVSRNGQNIDTGLTVLPTATIGAGQTAQKIITADATKKQGFGKWQVYYGTEANKTIGDDKTDRNLAVILDLPDGTVLDTKTYKTNIHWQLHDDY